MSRDKENLRDSPCEKKFYNSIIRDINPETLRDSPCEEKFDNSQITSRWSVGPKDKSRDNKTVTSAMLRVKINQFANSIIRDKKKTRVKRP